MPNRGRPTVVAWCESDAASASERSAETLEWVQWKESDAANSLRYVSGLPPTGHIAPADVESAAHRVVDGKTRRGGVRRLLVSGPAIGSDRALRILSALCRESPS